MRTEASALIKHAETMGSFKASFLAGLPATTAMSAEAAVELATKLVQPPNDAHDGETDGKSNAIYDAMESARQQLLATAGYLLVVQGNLHMSVLASLAGAVVWMAELPIKLNPVIQPLMAAIKREQEEALQQPAAEALAEVIVQCVGRKPSPNEKLIKNLCALTCADPVETPKATEANAATVNIEDIEATPVGKVGKNMKLQLLSASEERSRLEGAITRRGAEFSLKSLCEKFGDTLLEQLLKLWECLTEALGQPSAVAIPGSLPELTADPQALITNLQVVRSVAPVVDKKLHPKMLSLLPAIFSCVRHEHAAVRLVASRCITSMARVMTEPVMAEVLKLGVPMLGDITSVEARQGAGMLVTSLVDGLGPELIAYAPLLIVPLLGCMSDSNLLVRQSVTNSFAALVPLLPLARGVPAPGGLDECQASKSAEDTRFLDQLLDNSQVEDYKLTVPIKATLRRCEFLSIAMCLS
jgi:TATA-binding protein-associated factor